MSPEAPPARRRDAPLAADTYSFYSVSTSNVGLIQQTPSAPQATTTVSLPTPTPTPTSPTIISEQLVFTRKPNKKHKPASKAVLTGFELEFSTAMNPATAGDSSNYQVDWVSIRRVKPKKVEALRVVPVSVDYNPAAESVSLLLVGKQAFAQGGQITVVGAPPNGVSSTAGVLLDGNDEGVAGNNGVFMILPKAQGITRG